MRSVDVLVVHHHRLHAEILARRLKGEPGIRVTGIASTGATAKSAISVLDPRVTVLDMELADVSGFELAAQWSSRDPSISVAAILGSDECSGVVRAIRAGASAVTTKDGPIADVVDAVTALASGSCWVPPRLLGGLVREMQRSLPPPNIYDEKLATLTLREREILQRMAAGRDRIGIARELGISVNTVRTHAQNLLEKLGVHSTLEAVCVANRSSNGRLPA